jgi:hypothetical protein
MTAKALFTKLKPDQSSEGVVDYFRMRAGLEPAHGGGQQQWRSLRARSALAAPTPCGGAAGSQPMEILALPNR